MEQVVLKPSYKLTLNDIIIVNNNEEVNMVCENHTKKGYENHTEKKGKPGRRCKYKTEEEKKEMGRRYARNYYRRKMGLPEDTDEVKCDRRVKYAHMTEEEIQRIKEERKERDRVRSRERYRRLVEKAKAYEQAKSLMSV
mgnify:CR=1 FL=1